MLGSLLDAFRKSQRIGAILLYLISEERLFSCIWYIYLLILLGVDMVTYIQSWPLSETFLISQDHGIHANGLILYFKIFLPFVSLFWFHYLTLEKGFLCKSIDGCFSLELFHDAMILQAWMLAILRTFGNLLILIANCSRWLCTLNPHPGWQIVVLVITVVTSI